MISFSSSGSSSAFITSCNTNDCWNWPVLTHPGRTDLYLEISVQNEIVIFCWTIADWAGPCWLLLVHHQEQGSVETLNCHLWAVHLDLVSVSFTWRWSQVVGLHGIDILIFPSGQLTVTLAAQISTMLGNELKVLSINLQVGGGNAILIIG